MPTPWSPLGNVKFNIASVSVPELVTAAEEPVLAVPILIVAFLPTPARHCSPL